MKRKIDRTVKFVFSRTLRRLLDFFLVIALSGLPAFGMLPTPCVGGNLPVGTFKLELTSPKGDVPLPIDTVNLVEAGDKLKFAPVDLPQSIRNTAKIAVVLVPASETSGKHIEVLSAKPAATPAEWSIPMRSSVVGVIFGPRGLDMKKVNNLVKKQPELIPELAAYAKQTATVNALVSTLSQYEQSTPGTENLNAVLSGFSAQYGVLLPRLDAAAPADQQASLLLQAVIPTMSTYNPLASNRDIVMQQSAGLAASVASLFYGTPIGLAVGGAALVENLRIMVSPNTDFHAAFVQSKPSTGMELCSQNEIAKPRTRIAYLWMLSIPDAQPPAASLVENANVLVGSSPTLKITCATHAQLQDLGRARDWRLASAGHTITIPVKITVGTTDDSLVADLSHTTLPAGQYQLEAYWDWSKFIVKGTMYVHHLSNFGGVTPTPASQDQLLEGNGPVDVKLTGADFEFVQKVAIRPAGQPDFDAQELKFRLPGSKEVSGAQPNLEVRIDAANLQPGPYELLLTQSNGNAQPVPVVVHPPNPKIRDLPLRANLDEPQQVLLLHGSWLERIQQLASPGAKWTLAPLPEDSKNVTDREATIKLLPSAKKGDILNAVMTVTGIHDPIKIGDIVQVAGPRPKILSVDESLPKGGTVMLQPGEIPAGSPVSFAIRTSNVDVRPSLQLACEDSYIGAKPLELQPGDMQGSTQLDFAGEGVLFLSLDPGSVGQSGCKLTATVVTSDTGDSDPYILGRVVRLPQIDKFTLSDQRAGKALYEGFLTGQNLQMIARTGWNSNLGYMVEGIPTPVPGSPQEQTLEIQLAWPPPSPGAPVYIWLRGEDQGRRTSATY